MSRRPCGVGARRLGSAGEGILQMRARRLRKLAAQPAADAGAQAVLPRMYALQQRALVRWTRRAPAELVDALQLLKELHRVVDAIDAKLQRMPRSRRSARPRACRPRRKCASSSARNRARLPDWLSPGAASISSMTIRAAPPIRAATVRERLLSSKAFFRAPFMMSFSKCSTGRRRGNGDCRGADANRAREMPQFVERGAADLAGVIRIGAGVVERR